MAKLNRLNQEIYQLAKKYYNTTDLTVLTPYQLNKITNWATNTNPDTKAKISGNKYSGKTYNQIKKIF